MHQLILLQSCDYLKKISIKINVATDEGNGPKCIWYWTNDEIGVAVAHGLIAQSVRASERNSVVMGSSPTQANFP